MVRDDGVYGVSMVTYKFVVVRVGVYVWYGVVGRGVRLVSGREVLGGWCWVCWWLWSCEQWAMDGERVVIVGVGG